MKYSYKTLTLFLLAFCFMAMQAVAQGQKVSGTVTSASDGEALIGVNVTVKGSSTGTITDFDGKYNLDLPAGSSLTFSYVGFTEQTIAVGLQSVIDIQMVEGKALSEVVVTALGISREKKALGYAVQEVSGDDLVSSREANIVNGLQGKVAGVQITSASGAPGAGASILIRGSNSLSPGSNNQPLFVVDGIPISNETVAGGQLPSSGSNSPGSSEQASFTNRAADINPNDVESISVLKGAAATALYGIRGANGVILITTKQGKEGTTRVDFTTTIGYDEIVKQPALQTGYREGRHGRLRFFSSGAPLRFQSYGPKVYDGLTPVFNPIDDFFQTGMRREHAISISGGNKKGTYITSFSNFNQEGIIPFSDWSRTTARVGGSYQVTSNLKVSGNVNYIKSGGNKPHSGDKSIMSSLSYYSTSFDINDYLNPDGSQKDYSGGIIDNPRYLAEFSTLKDDVNRILGNIQLEYKATDWLTFDYKLGNDFYNDSRKRVVPAGLDLSSKTRGFTIEENINFNELTSLFLAKMNKQVNDDISVNLTLGHNLTDRTVSRTNIRGEGFVLNNFYDLSNTTNLFSTKNDSRYRTFGVLALLNIGYANAVYLDLTARNDWTSTLPSENRSFFYPSASLSWVISDMVEMPSLINFLKVRGSLAKVSKDAPAQVVGFYYEADPTFPFGSVAGFRKQSTAGDSGLRPETTTGLEAGLEVKLLNNRLGFEISVYKENAVDQIIPVPVSNATGFSRFWTNAGEIENKGVELVAYGTPVVRGDFRWDMALNWSTQEGTVVSIRDGIDEIALFGGGFGGITNKLVPGGKVGDLYGWSFEKNEAGQLLIDDNGYPVNFFNDKTVVGNAVPDWIASLTNTFSYKGLALSVLWEWKNGGDVYDLGFRNSLRNGSLAETERRYEQVVFQGVLEDGTANTTPVEISGERLYRNSRKYNRMSEIILQDASWFRLRRVSLSYRLPDSILGSKRYIKGAQLVLSGNNLFINTPFRGYDPETSYFGSGSNITGYVGLQTPGIKSFTATINVSF